MNREIKFRVWSDEFKEMYVNDFNDFVMPENSPLFQSGLDQNGKLFCGQYLDNGDYEDCEIMQYTGLKYNGKDIYEDDLRIGFGQDNSFLQVIEFHNTAQSCGRGWIARNIAQIKTIDWKANQKITIVKKIDSFSYFGFPSSGEIIGNIHEHKHLLPQQTNN